jgi:hypothetical protein
MTKSFINAPNEGLKILIPPLVTQEHSVVNQNHIMRTSINDNIHH